MKYRFSESSNHPHRFFSTLPADWQEGIIPHWEAYQSRARVFILETDTEVLGGGIVFSSPSPDTHVAYQQEAERWFDEGYLYIGYLWISEQHRDKQLGSAWLQSLFSLFPAQKFWLSIEDFRLASFYKRNGFELIDNIVSDDVQEWVLAMPCKNSSAPSENPSTEPKKLTFA